MIERSEPASWRDLQVAVGRILGESGVAAEVEKVVETARGSVSIDVWAHDSSATPPQTYLIECKRWRARVPKTVVHAFRTVVGDSGANWGAIISAAGFQPGAYAAAQYSNVRLLTWPQFVSLFEERWFEKYFLTTLSGMTDRLMDYTGFSIGPSGVFHRLGSLSVDAGTLFGEASQRHMPLATLCLFFRGLRLGPFRISFDEFPRKLDLPLREVKEGLNEALAAGGAAGLRIPAAILEAESYRALLDEIAAQVNSAVAEFDAIFAHR